MDFNDVRSFITVLSLVTFVGIVFWAYGSRRKQAFDEAALLPFSEEEFPPSLAGARQQEGEAERAGKREGKREGKGRRHE